jgi:pSer/pThr/pTyr-binding forkhead associated (FHA) protein
MSTLRAETDATTHFRLTCEGVDEPPFTFDRDVTLGKHFDNDFVVAGEDVSDFHARVEVDMRAVRLVPLAGCVVQLGDRVLTDPYGMMPGDRFALGLHWVRLELDTDAPLDVELRWALVSRRGQRWPIAATDLVVGRGIECGLRITSGHVSRQHALVGTRGPSVWLRDFDSSNGTFVNGERVRGACRIFHGDVVSFDTESYQLLGEHPDLTPVAAFDPVQLSQTAFGVAVATQVHDGASTTGGSQVRDAAQVGSAARASPADSHPPSAPRAPPRTPSASVRTPPASGRADAPGGVRLCGIARPIAGQEFRLGFGRHQIGRARDATVSLDHPDITEYHAELDVRADGVFLTNLAASSATRVNDRPAHTTRLRDGDRIAIGPMLLEFRAPPAAAPNRMISPTHALVLAALAAAAAALALGFLLI